MREFEVRRTVKPEEIDGLGHVNNLVYLGWFMEAAEAHTEACGMPGRGMLSDGEGWVVRRHEIDYLAQVRVSEQIAVRTWIEWAEKASSLRRYEVVRTSDGRAVCRGLTMWVWINYGTGRPARIPDRVYAAYGIEKGREAGGDKGPAPEKGTL